jgi:hypothetical protein
LALVAINASKDEIQMRPHFRHPKGALRESCMVVAGRAAALRIWREDGWIELPRRRRSATAIGFSGQGYEAWAETEPKRVRISDVSYLDTAQALLTLTGGQQVLVELRGRFGADYAGAESRGMQIPTLSIEVDGAALSGLDAAQIRSRLRLLPDPMCWRSHWDDSNLDAQAAQDALYQAIAEFDAVAEGFEFPPGLPLELRRETLLHLEVKRILAEKRRFNVPGLDLPVEVHGRTTSASQRVQIWPELLSLEAVELEQRYGRLVPDVTCSARGNLGARYEPLHVEVTVTNHIDEERMARIREHDVSTVEIDLSRAGGRIRRDALEDLVVRDLSLKRWLHHPKTQLERARFEVELEKSVAVQDDAHEARALARAKRRELIATASLAALASEYLGAVIRLLDARVAVETARGTDRAALPAAVDIYRLAQEEVANSVDKLTQRGYSEAGDESLIGDHGILSRVLSCKLDRPVGYRYENVIGVLNAARQSSGVRRSTFTVILIAARTYKPKLSATQEAWLNAWSEEVRNSIRVGERVYLREAAYDRFLKLLFPEIGAALEKPFGKRKASDTLAWDAKCGEFVREPTLDRRPCPFLATQPRTDLAAWPLVDTDYSDWWLKGSDLERWRQERDSRSER